MTSISAVTRSEISVARSFSISSTTIRLDLVRSRTFAFVRSSFITFVHSGGTIIFGIEEVPLSQILDQHWEDILHWATGRGGVPHWDRDDRASYQAKLEADGYKAWDISSSIGFEGFVIAKSIEDGTHEFTPTA